MADLSTAPSAQLQREIRRLRAQLADTQAQSASNAQRIAEQLHTVGENLAHSISLDDVLNTLLDGLSPLVPYDSANVMLRDSSDTLRIYLTRGYDRWTDVGLVEQITLNIADVPQMAELIESRRSQIIRDTSNSTDWRRFVGTEHIGCWIGIPLIAGGEVIGVYSLDRCEPNSFTADDIRLAETLAATAATAIDRMRAFAQLKAELAERARAERALAEERTLLAQRVDEQTHELRRALDRLQTLQSVTNSVITSDSLADALQHTVDQICAILSADRIMMLIFDWEHQAVEHLLSGGRGSEMVISVSYEEYMGGLTGLAVRDRCPIISPNAPADPRESPESLKRRAETQCGAVAVVPLYYLEEVFGTLTAINRLDQPDFTEADVELMEAVASQIAMLYARSRLTARLQQTNHELQAEIATRAQLEQQNQWRAWHATALASLSQTLSEAGLDQQSLFDLIARQIAELFQDGCIVSRISEDRSTRRTVAVAHADPAQSALMRAVAPDRQIPIEGGLVGQVVRTGQALLMPQMSADDVAANMRPAQDTYATTYPTMGVVIVPMRARGHIIGTITILRNMGGLPYTSADQDLLQDLADRAGLAIENARLFAVAERSRAEAESAARLKDDFLASMSHELRTPLSAVLGRAELLRDEVYGPVNARQSDALRVIDESGRHLLSLINDILDLSKIEAGKLSLVQELLIVQDLCQASLRLVAQTAQGKQIAVSSKVDSALTIIQADSRRLKQILVNLLSNAVKFTPSGGSIGLEAVGDAQRQRVVFTVWDTGIGISPENLARLFQPFVQIDSSLSRQYTGTGLGLALVDRLTKAHGGSIHVESMPGQGSRFSISIPWIRAGLRTTALDQPGEHGEHAPEQAPVLADQRPLILLAEDRPENVAMFQDYLQGQGYRVIAAGNGSDALAQAQMALPDLIVIDVQMPGVNGLEAMRRIRASPELRTTPIVALTAIAMPGDRERCLAAGANSYLMKPISLRALLGVIKSHLPHT
jgi:signal transduction histidine kinase/ActR/RegA family two-component response regulator